MTRALFFAATLALLPGCTANMLFAGAMAVIAEHDRPEPPAAIDPNRPVRDQDCTQPIARTGGNLRCR